LTFQKKVRKLREEREKYADAIKNFMKFGEKNMVLLDSLENTR
jgi:archaellum biogenesis ATPase FlaH